MAKSSTKQQAVRLARSIATECVGARVRMLNRALTQVYDEELRPLGLKFSQMNILTAVTLTGPVQPRDIAEALCIEKSTLSRNLRVMEKNGWIESTPGETGRDQLLESTPAGVRLLEEARPAWRRAQSRVRTMLGDEAIDSLLGAVDDVRYARI